MNDIVTRLQTRLARLGPLPQEVAFAPEPLWIGDAERARKLTEGVYRFAGQEVVAPRLGPWRLIAPTPAFAAALHGFDWLDDFAAAATSDARRAAQSWTFGWIATFGDGDGPGWTPELTGQRLVNMLSHAQLLLKDAKPDMERRLLRALAIQTRFALRRRRAARQGLPRIRATTGLLYAALSLDGFARLRDKATMALGADAAAAIDDDGAVASRNPEELCEIQILLATARHQIDRMDLSPDPRMIEAMTRAQPVLRALRMRDGSLARFQGGRAGGDGRLDHALALTHRRRSPRLTRAMGFERLAAGRTAVVVDAAPPPATPTAHASTLAFELVSHHSRVIVNCGPGAQFGADWAEACRATAAQATLSIERTSSARIAPKAKGPGPHPFVHGPHAVEAETAEDVDGAWLLCSHDGYVATHGLIHRRRLFLSPDGRDFRGEDALEPPEGRARRKTGRAGDVSATLGIPFAARFHIHPDIRIRDGAGADAFVLSTPDADWHFTADGGDVSIEDSIYFDPGHTRPRATKQIVVSARAISYRGRVTWGLRRVDHARAARPRAEATA